MHNLSGYLIFQQDSAPAKEAVDLSTETPAFIPPNSPDWNPVDYKVLQVLHEQLFKLKVNKVDDLHQRIQTVWDELDHGIIA